MPAWPTLPHLGVPFQVWPGHADYDHFLLDLTAATTRLMTDSAEVDDLRSHLLRLFELSAVPGEWDPAKPSRTASLANTALSFEGEAERLLYTTTQRLSRHALEEGGPHPTPTEKRVIDACFESFVRPPIEVADELLASLDQPASSFTVVAPFTDVRFPRGATTLEVGQCLVTPEHPALDLRDPHATVWDRFEGQTITTEAWAVDFESARVIAYDRFDTARAILAAGNADLRPQPDTLLVCDDGSWTSGGGRHPGIFPYPVLTKDGSEFRPGWQQMSDAAALDAADRAEWAERALQAARWLRRARTEWWASQRIVACFAALEALFLPANSRGKGRTLADDISRRWQLWGHTQQSQAEWLRNAYSMARGNAIHEGQGVTQDLDADRLEGLTQFAVKWGVWHLDPDHIGTGSPCTTRDEAHDQTKHAKREPSA